MSDENRVQEQDQKVSRRNVLKAAMAAGGAAALGFPAIVKAQGPISMRWQSTWPQKDIFHEYANDFAKKVNDMHKLVLSHGEVELAWKNSELLHAEDSTAFKRAIAQLKDMPGKNIAVDSGEGTWRSFLENDLWDGLDMLVHPLVIGNGKPLFALMPVKVPLRLVESKAYDNGVVNLRYERL